MRELVNKKEYGDYIRAFVDSMPAEIKDAYRRFIIDGELSKVGIEDVAEGYAQRYFVDIAGGTAQYKPEEKLPAYKERQNRRNRRVSDIKKLESDLLTGYLPAIRGDEVGCSENVINCFEESNIERTMEELGSDRNTAINTIKKNIEEWAAVTAKYANSIKTKVSDDPYQGFCTYPYLECLYPSRSLITLILIDIEDWIYRVGQSEKFMSMLGRGQGDSAHYNDDTNAFDREEAMDSASICEFFLPAESRDGVKVTKNINWDRTDWKIVLAVISQAVTQCRHRTGRLKARGYLDILSVSVGTTEADMKERLERLQKTGIKAVYPNGIKRNTSVIEAVELSLMSNDEGEAGIGKKEAYKVTLSSFVLESMIVGLLRSRRPSAEECREGSLRDSIVKELSLERIRSLIFSATADSIEEYAIGRLTEIHPVAGDLERQKKAYAEVFGWMKENRLVIEDVTEDVLDMSGRWTVKWLPLSMEEARKADGLEGTLSGIAASL